MYTSPPKKTKTKTGLQIMSQQHFLYDTNYGISVLALWSPGFGSFTGFGAVLGTLGVLAVALAGVEAGSIVGKGRWRQAGPGMEEGAPVPSP